MEDQASSIATERIRWHSLEVDDAVYALNSSRNGLSTDEAKSRLDEYGRNEFREEQAISPYQIILQQIKSPLIYILLVAAVISFAVGHLIDAFVILGVVVINTVIGFIQEFRAEKAMEALRQLSAPTAIVLRDGERKEIPASDVVPGDVIVLAAGDRISADARIIEAANLKTDEASLTGESLPVEKSVHPLPENTPLAEQTNMVFAATSVTYGRCEALVVATATSTVVGQIAENVTSTVHEPTPIQTRLSSVGRTLAIIALTLAVIILISGIIRGINFIEMFLFAIASAVSAIPEGLPAVVTVVLALGLQRMVSRHAVIRVLPAVETLGSATVICSDKTGTLTKNEMTVRAIYTPGQEFTITGEGYEPRGDILINGKTANIDIYNDLRLVLHAAVLCNDARLICSKNDCTISGDPTEGALLTSAAKAGIDQNELLNKMPRIAEIPFNSEQAYMATLNDSEDRQYIFVKGATEKLINLCSRIIDNGQNIEFTSDRRESILQINRNYASKALRVLGLACKEVPKTKSDVTAEDLREGLVFIGLVGMIDPPRPEAIEAIERCKRAGIRVMMATGDHKITARAIAEQMGILREHGAVVDGREIASMSDDELTERIDSIDVFARVEPDHKLRIVKALKKKGQVVAMTGDGVNDAPALKRADIGIAMGITGTDVSKEAADMVLTDDNFASIVAAVEEGRIVYGNIKKVVTYLVSTNTGEMLIIITTVLMGLPLPLIPVQILWVNLITDSFPALALAADPPREDVLSEPPVNPRDRIISRGVIYRLIFVAVIMAIGTVWLFYTELISEGILKARTIAFAAMAIFQLFNSMNVRSPRQSVFKIGVFTNKWLNWAFFAGILLQVAAIHLPFMRTLFRTVPLNASEWLFVIVVSSTVLWASELRKLIAPNMAD
ncbi:MAG: HAD-IC family P-type ATPase [Armatimonadota bacterium]